MIRKIIHIDMDAFFTSVEQRDHPELKGKPIVVGGTSNRSVVAAASYEARLFGIHSAMSTIQAKTRCPHIIIVKPNMKKYKEASSNILSILHEYTDQVEPLSIDEAFLDVTFEKEEQSATILAQKIRCKIKKETKLTASAGVSYNKFLAKVASDVNKPDGLFVIPPEKAIDFLETLEIEKFYGVGKVAVTKFHNKGILNGLDLKKESKANLICWFGKSGEYYYNIVRGIDNRKVEPYRKQKSIGAEQTFEKDISDKKELSQRLSLVIDRMWQSVEKKQAKGKTITLKIKFMDFEIITRSHTLYYYISTKEQITRELFTIFEKELPLPKPVRLIGATLSNLKNDNMQSGQLSLKL